MSTTLSASSTPLLPCPITLQNGSDSAHNIVVTISKVLPHVHVDSLTPELFASRKSVWLSPESLKDIGGAHACLVAVQTLHSDVLRHGILVHGLAPNSYELLDGCMEPFDLEAGKIGNGDGCVCGENTEKGNALVPSIGEYIELWLAVKVGQQQAAVLRAQFSMRPPLVPSLDKPPSPLRYTISPQNEKTPVDFLRSRYFSTLYSLSTPLSYFPKTALARFKNMCSNDCVQVLECLSQVYLSQAQLEERRLAKYGLRKPGAKIAEPSLHMCRFEAESQAQLLGKHHEETVNDELLEHLVLELKIREAHLQIVLLMEILVCMEVEEKAFLEAGRVQQEQVTAKRRTHALIRRKKKKVVPTFLGVGVAEPDGPTEPPGVAAEADHVSPPSLYAALATLLDQIGLWDSLLEHGKTEKDEHTHGFVAFVLVPFFGKRLPRVVLFVARQIKNMRPNILKPKVPKAERKISRTLFPAPGSSTTPGSDTTPGSGTTPGSELLQRIMEWTRSLSTLEASSVPELPGPKPMPTTRKASEADQLPSLRRAATTMGPMDMQPAFLLKRSKSNLGARNLKRRQVDMSVARTDAPDEGKAASLFLFTDARKVRTGASLAQSAASVVVRQVEATPAKPKPPAPVAYAPQVLATPSNRRTVDVAHVVAETPQGRAEKSASINEQLARLASTAGTVGVVSSPVREEETGPSLAGRVARVFDSSPVKVVDSSPVQVRRMGNTETKPPGGVVLGRRSAGTETRGGGAAGRSTFSKNDSDQELVDMEMSARSEAGRPATFRRSPFSNPSRACSPPLLPLAKRMVAPRRSQRKAPERKKTDSGERRTGAAIGKSKKTTPGAARLAKTSTPERHPFPELACAAIFDIGSADPANNDTNISAKGTVQARSQGRATPPAAMGTVQDSTGASRSPASLDSDSDYEKLVAAALKPAKRYGKKRAL